MLFRVEHQNKCDEHRHQASLKMGSILTSGLANRVARCDSRHSRYSVLVPFKKRTEGLGISAAASLNKFFVGFLPPPTAKYVLSNLKTRIYQFPFHFLSRSSFVAASSSYYLISESERRSPSTERNRFGAIIIACRYALRASSGL
jgi:hypothetical protein